MKIANPIICALDMTDTTSALELAGKLKGKVGAIKLGLEFFSANGASGVKALEKLGIPIFLDLKLHDIPNTVGKTVKALNPLKVFMLTIHASGGKAMMKAAIEAAKEATQAEYNRRPLIVGVTALTSLDGRDIHQIGIDQKLGDYVKKLALLAKDSGLDGVVCSSHEIKALRKSCGDNFTLVVPGIRPSGSAKGDQKRVMTPKQAIKNGANFLVIGRPITESKSPTKTAEKILKSIIN